MSDIVERLRRAPASWPVCHEAAAEIERLQAALRELRDAISNTPLRVEGRADFCLAIDRALSGKGES